MKIRSGWKLLFASLVLFSFASLFPFAHSEPSSATSSTAVQMPTQYSVDMTSTANGMKVVSKTYADGDKMRTESDVNGMASVAIMRSDEKKMYALMPSQKMYMEFPMNVSTNPLAAASNGQWSAISDETINGQVCTKYHVTTLVNGKPSDYFYWISKADQLPVRMATADGKMTTDWANFKKMIPPPSLFEVPADYKPMEMPAGIPAPGM